MYDRRKILASDANLICDHRERIFLESGKDKAKVLAMAEPFRAWLKGHLGSGSYYGFVMTDNNAPIASIGLMTIDWPPHPAHPLECHRGYVLNLYVEPEYRHKGIAKELMLSADQEFIDRGAHCSILHPTQVARPIYESLGWEISGEMTKSTLGLKS
jgi:GNAT superfamily N-acetyltransferase